ncbi:MAG: hypothetical protein ACOC84_07835 [Actinomycetota bacterium]
MRQSHRHHLPATGPRGRHEPVGETTSAPVHCGRPMVVRRLDVLHPESSANRMILDVAVTGRCVHACRCGFLLESPATDGPAELLDAPADAGLFRDLFLRRVTAAAGALESAQWTVDQATGDGGPAGGGQSAAQLWAFDAAVESAWWAFDQAGFALQAELRLAARQGVPLHDLAVAAGMSQEAVEESLTGPWPSDGATGR